MIAATLIGSSTLTSCFKDEPLNAECDIEQAYIHVDNPLGMFFQQTDTLVNVLSTAEDINFVVRKTTDLTALAPIFNMTPGATIYPDNGSEQDFSNGPIRHPQRMDNTNATIVSTSSSARICWNITSKISH